VKLVLTCEHGGYEIPSVYKEYFKDKNVLKTHRGYDLGALDLFHFLEPLSDASFSSTTSRLFIELNRSLHHKQLFSEFTKGLSKKDKTEIIKDYYQPYRSAVENKIKSFIENQNSVLHLSIHSFTPQLNNKTRNCDIGLLYDSARKTERHYCKELKDELLKQDSNLNVRFNYPYLGKSDGFTSYLRTQFPIHYLGIEIEINQKFASEDIMTFEMKQMIYNAIKLLKPENPS
jgi:predicted N-formylglutamate amidohydrolase